MIYVLMFVLGVVATLLALFIYAKYQINKKKGEKK